MRIGVESQDIVEAGGRQFRGCQEKWPGILKVAQMFTEYAAMTMEERDTIAAEWMKTIQIEEPPVTSGPKK